jgi:hypothetical protein
MEQQKGLNKLEHPCFPQPKDLTVKVWRYMDTSKLLDILARKSLFLSRLNLLGDAHEGSITKVNHITRQSEFEKHGIDDHIPSMIEASQRFNQSVGVNCWYLDNYESEAMWKLYCPDNKGVAIQTTYKKLVDSINHDENLYIGLIKYIDYETEWFPSGNIFYPIMHKRKAFQYEKEIRLVKPVSNWFENTDEPPSGVYCDWDMETYAENIYVNPYSQNWYYEIIKDVVAKYSCKIDIKWSTIKGSPYY